MKRYLVIRRDGEKPYICFSGLDRNKPYAHIHPTLATAEKECAELNSDYGRTFTYTVEDITIKKARSLGYKIEYGKRVK
jgi:hypothetical protein